MTDAATDAPARKQTAMEVAREALQLAEEAKEQADAVGELRAQFGTITADLRERGVGGPFPPSGVEEKVQALDKDVEGLLEDLNQVSGRLAAVEQRPAGAGGGNLEAVQALEARVAEHFKKMSESVDARNEAAKEAIGHVRNELDGLRTLLANPTDQPNVDHALAEMEQRVTTLAQDIGGALENINGKLAQQGGAVEMLLNGSMKPGAFAEQAPILPGNPLPTQRTTPAVYRQVHQLMKLVAQIGKDSQADKKMGGYKFRSIEAVMDAVGIALREVGLMFQPREIVDKRVERYETVSKDGFRQNWTHVWVTQNFVFVSLEDGSEMPATQMDGEARDNGDKSTSKADSMRYKYALLQALCIPVNDLPESDGRDGTEGDFAPAYGRQNAGDAFDSATPARPQPQQQAADAVQRNGAVHPGDTNTAVQSAPTPPPTDTRTPQELAQSAARALYGVLALQPGDRRAKYKEITDYATAKGLGTLTVRDPDDNEMTLNRFASLINAQIGVTG